MNSVIQAIIVISAIILLSACSRSSGVLKTRPDTFTISTSASPGRGGVPAARGIAYQEASEECSKRGLELSTISEKSTAPTWTEGMANMELNFKCVAK